MPHYVMTKTFLFGGIILTNYFDKDDWVFMRLLGWIVRWKHLARMTSGPWNPKQIVLKKMTGNNKFWKTYIQSNQVYSFTTCFLPCQFFNLNRDRERAQSMKSHVEPSAGWVLLSPVISMLSPLTKAYCSCWEWLTPY